MLQNIRNLNMESIIKNWQIKIRHEWTDISVMQHCSCDDGQLIELRVAGRLCSLLITGFVTSCRTGCPRRKSQPWHSKY